LLTADKYSFVASLTAYDAYRPITLRRGVVYCVVFIMSYIGCYWTVPRMFHFQRCFTATHFWRIVCTFFISNCMYVDAAALWRDECRRGWFFMPIASRPHSNLYSRYPRRTRVESLYRTLITMTSTHTHTHTHTLSRAPGWLGWR